MFAIGNVIGAFAWLLGELCFLAMILIVVRAVLSWVEPNPYNPLVRFVVKVTEPLLRPFQRILPAWRTGGLDLSPLFVLLAIKLVEMIVVKTLYQWASTFHS